MPSQRIVRVVLRDISFALTCQCDDIAYVVETLKARGQNMQGFCFVWETTSMTGKRKVIGVAPVFFLGDESNRVAFVAGTWFDIEMRRTKTHAPAIDGRVLQLLYEDQVAATGIIAAPGFNGDWEDKVLGLGFRPVRDDEVWQLPDIARQLGRTSLPRCRNSKTGLYCIDDIAIPMIAKRFEDYANHNMTGFWIRGMWQDVGLEFDLALVRHRFWKLV